MVVLRETDKHRVLRTSLDEVMFQDPFQDETRKAKRNLLAAGFASVLIATLELQVEGFLGLKASSAGSLGPDLTSGLACLTVGYFLMAFLFAVYVDYSAWNFRRERVLVKPYLELIERVSGHYQILSEQIRNATIRLEGLEWSDDMRTQIDYTKKVDESLGQLHAVANASKTLNDEVKPLLGSWARTVVKANRLRTRLHARMISLWVLDIAFPVLLACYGLWRTRHGVEAVLQRIAG